MLFCISACFKLISFTVEFMWFPGMLSAAASLGLIYLWDVDGGLTPIDKYLYTSEENIKVRLDFLWAKKNIEALISLLFMDN